MLDIKASITIGSTAAAKDDGSILGDDSERDGR